MSSINDDKKLKNRFYRSHVTHPMVNTSNDMFTQVDANAPRYAYAFGNYSQFQPETVTG
tara:strand:- start:1 stop:177 length:177 start_codon:yes stop_codon:yes gene_type:complete